jgi:hypothetical protein
VSFGNGGVESHEKKGQEHKVQTPRANTKKKAREKEQEKSDCTSPLINIEFNCTDTTTNIKRK